MASHTTIELRKEGLQVESGVLKSNKVFWHSLTQYEKSWVRDTWQREPRVMGRPLEADKKRQFPMAAAHPFLNMKPQKW